MKDMLEGMPVFPQLAFDQLNEADVREEVIAPLLRELGYRSGTEYDVIREQPLRYPRQFLGRKDLSKDPELRGKADYILVVERHIRWVIEAKAPDAPISHDEIEQAWTYANHAEVRAVYFALCNGRVLKVFQTNLAPDSDPLLTITYEEFSRRYDEVCNLLSPQSLLRDFPRREAEVGPPIGLGLRSVVRITSGLIRYDRSSLAIGPVGDLQFFVVGGAVERDEHGKLVAFLKTLAPLRSVQELNERLGLSSFEMESDDTALSTDLGHPSAFRYGRTITFPAGLELPDIVRWSKNVLAANLRVEIAALARGILNNRRFYGRFETKLRILEPPVIVEGSGPFEIHLA